MTAPQRLHEHLATRIEAFRMEFDITEHQIHAMLELLAYESLMRIRDDTDHGKPATAT